MRRMLLTVSLFIMFVALLAAPALATSTMSTRMPYMSNSGSTGTLYINETNKWINEGTRTYHWDEYLKKCTASWASQNHGFMYKIYLHYKDGHTKWFGPFMFDGQVINVPGS